MSRKGKTSTDEEFQRFMKVIIPLCCDAMVPVTAKLLKKHKEIKELDDELAVRREEFSTRMRKVEKRRQELKKKENLLIRSLKDFEDFTEEKECKRKEAEEKYFTERKFNVEIDKELEKLKEERETLRKRKGKLERCLKKYVPAYKFLETVADTSLQFEDVDEIITHYDMLSALNEELTKQESENLEVIDREREKLKKYKTEKENQLLAMNNELISLQKELDLSYDKVLAAESSYSDVKLVNSTKATTLGQITMAISSMYMTICNFEKVPPTRMNPVRQIEKVKEFIQDWSEVVPEVKKLEEKKK